MNKEQALMQHLITPRDKVKKNSAQVGKAVCDILSRPQGRQEVGETVDSMTPKYYDELLKAVEQAGKTLESPFYVIVMRKKEHWAVNVVRQWYVQRQTRPSPEFLREEFPNSDHDVWKADAKTHEVTLEWTLPTAQDSSTIIKNKQLYDENLVKWITLFNRGELT